MHNRVLLSVLRVCVFVLWLIPATGFSQAVRPPIAADWTAEDSMLLYFEAITQIRKKSLQRLTTQEIVRQTLRDYLRGLDPFADYLSPEELKQFRMAQQQHYAGVGIELRRDAAGRIVCVPYPQGPAMRAGIAAGDILEAVDGRPVTGQSLLAVSAQIRGEKGTQIRLTVAPDAGASRDIVIERTAIDVASVRVERHQPLPIVRILTFAKSTAHELRETLGRLAEAPALILDLRGNPGGALYSAIDAAKLFLTPGQTIVGIQTRDGLDVYRKEQTPAYHTVPLYLWQDEHTASAAEVFIAALVLNKRAVSLGKRTFGKGTVQDIIELADGSALYLTTGMLQTPAGTLYHDKGLEPTHALEVSTAGSEEYLAKVKALHLHRRIEALEMHIALTDRQAPEATPPLPRGYLLCFDKDFLTKQDAEIWASEVHLSLHEEVDYYQLKRAKPDGIYYMTCLGIYRSEKDAEKKRQTISKAMQENVFMKPLP